MTFEEIREMVNSTISDNGQRQITGRALNLALVETLTAIEDYLANNKPEGGGVETVYAEEVLTPEHQAVNAETYAKCAAAMDEGKPIPGIQVDTTAVLAAQIGISEGFVNTVLSLQTMFVSNDSPLAVEMSGLMVQTNDAMITVSEDGSIQILQ